VIAAARAESRTVTRVFHPEPKEWLLHLANGVHAHVEIGPAAYQLTSGEIIEL
jgi:hypothetical protein